MKCVPLLRLMAVQAAAQVSWTGGLPAMQIEPQEQWHPHLIDEELRRKVVDLTELQVVQALQTLGPRTQLLRPPCMKVAVGKPFQILLVALDTTAGSSWLIDVGSEVSQEGKLNDVQLFRHLASDSVGFLASAELRQRVQVPVGGALAGQSFVKGRVVTDRFEVAGELIPSQPFLLAEQMPAWVPKWKVAGVLALGMRDHLHQVTAPVVEMWRDAWVAGPGGGAADPTAAAQQRMPNAPPLRKPVVSFWYSPEDGVQGIATSSRSNMWLGVGSLPGSQWVSRSAMSSGWSVSGYVKVDAGPTAADRNVQREWPARFLVDSTLPALGVPMRYFSTVMEALWPYRQRLSCWWNTAATPGIQVQCNCAVAQQMNTVHLDFGGVQLDLNSGDLLLVDTRSDSCTALVWPLNESQETWHLGAPFLQRYAVSLDAAQSRMGFAAPPTQSSMGDLVEEVQSVALGTDTDQSNWVLEEILWGTPVVALGLLAVGGIATVLRGAKGRWSEWERDKRDYLAVATSDPPPGAEEGELTSLLCGDSPDEDEEEQTGLLAVD